MVAVASTWNKDYPICHNAATYACPYPGEHGANCVVTETNGYVENCVGYDPGDYNTKTDNQSRECVWFADHSQDGSTRISSWVTTSTCSWPCYT